MSLRHQDFHASPRVQGQPWPDLSFLSLPVTGTFYGFIQTVDHIPTSSGK